MFNGFSSSQSVLCQTLHFFVRPVRSSSLNSFSFLVISANYASFQNCWREAPVPAVMTLHTYKRQGLSVVLKNRRSITTARRCCGIFSDSGAGYKTADLFTYLPTSCAFSLCYLWSRFIMSSTPTRTSLLKTLQSRSFIIFLHFSKTRNKFHFSLVMHVFKMALILKSWQCAKLFDYVFVLSWPTQGQLSLANPLCREPTVNRCNKYSQTLAVNRSCVCVVGIASWNAFCAVKHCLLLACYHVTGPR